MKMRRAIDRRVMMRAVAAGLALALVACGAAPKTTQGKPSPPAVQEGLATWYGDNLHGGPTASGERFDQNAMTAAHRTLPMHTRVRVTNKRNGRSVVLRINDRGPFGNRRRIIDVSKSAARKLDMIEAGVVPVRVEVVK
jgi:rare lipoprotein A